MDMDHKGLIDKWSALVQVMAWCQASYKPLPNSMITQFSDAHLRHQALLC